MHEEWILYSKPWLWALAQKSHVTYPKFPPSFYNTKLLLLLKRLPDTPEHMFILSSILHLKMPFLIICLQILLIVHNKLKSCLFCESALALFRSKWSSPSPASDRYKTLWLISLLISDAQVLSLPAWRTVLAIPGQFYIHPRIYAEAEAKWFISVWKALYLKVSGWMKAGYLNTWEYSYLQRYLPINQNF